jgi:hypothetical protein
MNVRGATVLLTINNVKRRAPRKLRISNNKLGYIPFSLKIDILLLN